MNISKLGFGSWVGIFVLVVIALLLWQNAGKGEENNDRYAAMTSREAALICTTDMATEYHIHPELKIFINGAETPLPPNIGIKPGCMNSIHTHDGGGVIHVESPVEKQFTLGDFFAVWQEDFSRTKILDAEVTEKTELVVTVNGEPVDTYENTVLRDKDKIVITYQKK